MQVFLEVLDGSRYAFLSTNTSRPKILMAMHQTACLSNQPVLSHKKSFMRIRRYLLDTWKQGIIYKPDKSKGLECSGDWLQANAENA
jgi:hypothetical protein